MGRGGCQRRLKKYKRIADAKEYRETSNAEIKCVCLNARSITNKKNELDIMVDEIKPHIIDITES